MPTLGKSNYQSHGRCYSCHVNKMAGNGFFMLALLVPHLRHLSFTWLPARGASSARTA